MGRGWLARAVRLLSVLLLTVPILLLGALTAPRAAADDGASVRVSIDGMTPSLPKPGGTVRLTGKLTNISTVQLSNLQVDFWSAPLVRFDTADKIAKAIDAGLAATDGERTKFGNVYQNVPSDADRTLDPGEATSFDITAQVDDLYRSGVDTVYLIGVDLRGRTAPNGADVTLGRGRIFMPLVVSQPANALRITSLVVITSRPSYVRAGLLADDHLASELGAGGRLQTLLDAAGHTSASFAIDPALVQEIQTMSAGYQVRDEAGQTVPGTGQAAATAWLSRLTTLIRSGDGFRLPYGNPDLAALVHAQRQDLLQVSTIAATSVTLTEDLPLLVLPANGRADQAVVEAAEGLRPRAIVLADTSTQGSGPLLQGPGTAPIVTFSPGTLQGGSGPDAVSIAITGRQRILADTFLEARSAAVDSTVGRLRLITTASEAAAAGPPDKVSWLQASNLSKLLTRKPSQFDGSYRYSGAAREAELSPDQLQEASRIQDAYDTYADLLGEPVAIGAEERAVVARAVSSSWQKDSEGQGHYLDPIADAVKRVVDEGVGLSAAPRVLTTGRDATFPITVVNHLAPNLGADGSDRNTIRVAITFDSSNSQRLSVAKQQVPGGVAGGASATENVAVAARTNGTVRVVAQLVTMSGRPVGRPLPIEVNATQAGTTGWIIAIAAGVVLLGTTGLRIRQVTRERAAAGTAAPVVVSRPPEGIESGAERESLDV